MGLLYIHFFPTPHMYAIYNRRELNFSLNPSLDYLDNLALVDRTVGELRAKLEAAGLWEVTDQPAEGSPPTTASAPNFYGAGPLRLDGGHGQEIVCHRSVSQTVPFIVKLGGKQQHAAFDRPFSNIASGDMALAVLSGKVSTAEQALAWLDQQAAASQKLESHTNSNGDAVGGSVGGSAAR